MYQATYPETFAKRLRVSDTGVIDLGKAFDLLVGTSTGGIVACPLAAGIPFEKVLALYQVHSREIFPRQRLYAVLKLGKYVRVLFSDLAPGDRALRTVLNAAFGAETMGQVYVRRRIGLAITTVDLNCHASTVFKAPHMDRLNRRAKERLLVDACIAPSAALILRLIARRTEPVGGGATVNYADGGLWVKNPGPNHDDGSGECDDHQDGRSMPRDHQRRRSRSQVAFFS